MLDVKWENLDGAFAELEQEVTDIVRGITIESFHFLLRTSPQYYGRFVANWNYSLNTQNTSVNSAFQPKVAYWKTDEMNAQSIYKKGDEEAITYAMQNNAGVPDGFKLGDTVYFTNSVDHADDLEEGRIQLRAVNMPGRPMKRTLDRISSWYSNDVNHSRTDTLKRLRMY